MSFQKKFAIVIAAFAVVVVGWISIDFKSDEVPYISVSDLLENTREFSQDRFRLGGNVSDGSIEYSKDRLTVNFALEQGNRMIPVEYTSAALPDLFGDGAEVIVEGEYDGKLFTADNLMTKCASRYEQEDNYVPVSERDE